MIRKSWLIPAIMFLGCGVTWAAPPEIGPIEVTVENTPDVIVRNSELNPVPVDERRSSAEWISMSSRNGIDCSNGCSFASVGLDLSDPDFGQPLPAGTALLLKTITITYSNSLGQGGFVPANAAFQMLSPFQRHLVGEVLPTPGFTGADGMATSNLELVVPGGLTAVVGFTDPANRPTGSVSVDVYVSGEVIEVPMQ